MKLEDEACNFCSGAIDISECSEISVCAGLISTMKWLNMAR